MTAWRLIWTHNRKDRSQKTTTTKGRDVTPARIQHQAGHRRQRGFNIEDGCHSSRPPRDVNRSQRKRADTQTTSPPNADGRREKDARRDVHVAPLPNADRHRGQPVVRQQAIATCVYIIQASRRGPSKASYACDTQQIAAATYTQRLRRTQPRGASNTWSPTLGNPTAVKISGPSYKRRAAHSNIIRHPLLHRSPLLSIAITGRGWCSGL